MGRFQYSPSSITNHLPFWGWEEWGVWALPLFVTRGKLGLDGKSNLLGHTVGGCGAPGIGPSAG